MAAASSIADDFVLVAALDFGTTFSGYAFALRDDPEKIICNSNWGESMGFQSYKTPTSVLTNSAGDFITMGYEAEQQYHDKLEEEDGDVHKYHLYRHFKMMLRKSKDLSLRSTIASLDGNITPAVEIFGFAIRYLREHLLSVIQGVTACKIEPNQILWVITVPAIWSEPAKKFMREAAKLGGCIDDATSKNVLLALEPEAASMCCRRPKIAGYMLPEGSTLPPGIRYLLLDCGGGTIDITAHETLPGGKIQEILPASGGSWGGMFVDKRFQELLADIFGSDSLNHFKAQHPNSWLELISAFEMTKKAFNPDSKFRVRLPWVFTDFFTRTTGGKPIKRLIEGSGIAGVSFSNGALGLDQATVEKLFAPYIEEIIKHVGGLLKKEKLGECRYIFLVGGFSECKLLQSKIRERFEYNGTKVLIPTEPQLAVLKGAVLFGFNRQEIKARIAKMSYGYGTKQKFDHTIHNPKCMFVEVDGTENCRYIFDPLVKKGDRVYDGREIEKFTTVRRGKEQVAVRIFSMDEMPKRPVQYYTEPEVTLLGTLNIQCNKMMKNEIKSIYRFGETEISVQTINIQTGKEYSTTVDFLSESSSD